MLCAPVRHREYRPPEHIAGGEQTSVAAARLRLALLERMVARRLECAVGHLQMKRAAQKQPNVTQAQTLNACSG